MKKTFSVGLGGRNFIIDEDAYTALEKCLKKYEASLNENNRDVMEEIEIRIADLFRERLVSRDVVDLKIVKEVTSQMGLPEIERNDTEERADRGYRNNANEGNGKAVRKFYRDTDDRKIGGVCSGIANYLDCDVTIVRIIALIFLICAGCGFWIYLAICIAAPSAYTAAEKCELRGLPCTVENLSRFTNSSR